ncbi:solute carrier family 40 (iron-regulated transporter), member 1 [[Emmonsia] crescens]|uniref:Solute carrier family 40 member n=1 Tax=[Emmonsia] crescens TaxID=73230 RepID=A0A2B7Z9K3_9EURO|nr:solute carrier family 40 (iron-regulated transporter), member 1 [Emmonsia crescens]
MIRRTPRTHEPPTHLHTPSLNSSAHPSNPSLHISAIPPSSPLPLSLLYFTVLSFGSNMVAYLVTTGYTSTRIGVIRTVSVISEISATWITPAMMDRLEPIRAGM